MNEPVYVGEVHCRCGWFLFEGIIGAGHKTRHRCKGCRRNVVVELQGASISVVADPPAMELS